MTKLVQLYATRQWASLYPVEKSNVIMNMTAPGVCSTGLAHDTSAATRALIGTIRFFLRGQPRKAAVQRFMVSSLVTTPTANFSPAARSKSKLRVLSYILNSTDRSDSWWVPTWAKNEQGLHTQKQLWKELTEILEATSPGVISSIKSVGT